MTRVLLCSSLLTLAACSGPSCPDGDCSGGGGSGGDTGGTGGSGGGDGTGGGDNTGGNGGGACTPTTCAAQGKSCGSISDGCGAMLECGGCADPFWCGGGGTPNVCGASCLAGCPAGFTCNTSGVCAGGASSNLQLDVKRHAVSGRLTFRGMTPQNVGTGCSISPSATKATLTFFNDSDGLHARVPCSSASFEFSIALTPGTWRVEVSGEGNSNLPTEVFRAPDLVVAGPVSNHVIDVPAPHLVSGRITLDGAQPLVTCSGTTTAASVRFTDLQRGLFTDAAIPCNTTDFGFAASLFAGTYRVTVQEAPYAELPSDFELAAALVVSGPVTGRVFNVTRHPVNGRLTFLGMTPQDVGTFCSTSPGTAKALVDFSNGTGSVTAPVPCSSSTFSFSTALTAGTWQVRVRGYSNSYLPADEFRAPDLVVAGPVNDHVVDVKAPSPVTGRITVNGAQPVKSCAGTTVAATVTFTDAQRGDSVVPIRCNTSDFGFSVSLFPGTYRVTLEASSYTDLPMELVLAPAFVVSGPVTGQVFDAKKHPVGGRLTLLGMTPQNVGGDCAANPGVAKAHVVFNRGGDSASVDVPCSSPTFAFSTALAAGTWRVRVSGNGNSNLPSESFLAPDLVVAGPVTHHVIDVGPLRQVSGRVTVNGVMPTVTCTGTGTAASVRFTEVHRSFAVDAPIPCSTTNFAFSLPLYPGTYRVTLYQPLGTDLPSGHVFAERLALQ